MIEGAQGDRRGLVGGPALEPFALGGQQLRVEQALQPLGREDLAGLEIRDLDVGDGDEAGGSEPGDRLADQPLPVEMGVDDDQLTQLDVELEGRLGVVGLLDLDGWRG